MNSIQSELCRYQKRLIPLQKMVSMDIEAQINESTNNKIQYYDIHETNHPKTINKTKF
jgi:hypothetical protein